MFPMDQLIGHYMKKIYPNLISSRRSIKKNMNKYERAFKRYRRVIERMSGWETVYAGLSYETFCLFVMEGVQPYVKYLRMAENDSTLIDKYIERHKMI